ncbi:MAG TPA: 30S ribosomal protein S1 [Thermomicrobiales bacterium]|nr:30S ribosomal protein S1 [Thermomicrobiales bacterium]
MEDRATRMDGAETMPGTPPLQSEQREDGAPVAPPVAEAAGTPVAPGADGEVSLMQQLLDDPSHDYRALKYGDVLDGVIMQRDRDEFLIDIGSKSEGIIPSREYSTLTSDEAAQLKVGDKVLVFVVQPENQEGHTVLSIDKARQEKSWRVLQEHYDKNEVIQAAVTNYNKGGLLVNLDGVRGFVPASQVTEIRGGDDASKQADMARLVGQVLPLKVIEINRHRNRLILSERMAVQERRDAMKEKLIENLHEGETKRGRVSSIADFGAFVDIGGADGLVHLSEISWSRVKHPSEVLKVGDEVDVYVLNVNPQEKKIALSIKRTQPEPWSRVAQKYEIGQIVPATITQLANFGAFARIEDGIEGLIHVSELSDERVNHPREVVQEGQDVQVRIIRIDPQRRRMGLSLRRAIESGGFDPAFAVSPRREAGPVGLDDRAEAGPAANGEATASESPDHEPTTATP